jgi:YD repeat-containing protein
LAERSVLYSQLTTTDWASGNRTVEYTYDDNGSLISKTTKVTSTQEVIETVTYIYNLQNRLKTVTHYSYEDIDIDTNDDHIKEVTSYTYNSDGIRVAADYERRVDYYPLEGTFVGIW